MYANLDSNFLLDFGSKFLRRFSPFPGQLRKIILYPSRGSNNATTIIKHGSLKTFPFSPSAFIRTLANVNVNCCVWTQRAHLPVWACERKQNCLENRSRIFFLERDDVPELPKQPWLETSRESSRKSGVKVKSRVVETRLRGHYTAVPWHSRFLAREMDSLSLSETHYYDVIRFNDNPVHRYTVQYTERKEWLT